MQKQHADHIGKQLVTRIRGVLRDLNDTIEVESYIALTDINGDRTVVMLDGTYPQTRTLIMHNGDIVGRYENHLTT